MLPFGLGTSASWGLEVDLFLACYLCDVLVTSKSAQEPPKRPQEPPKMRPRGPKTPQERPKRPQEASKSAPGGPKRTTRDPKSLGSIFGRFGGSEGVLGGLGRLLGPSWGGISRPM